MNIPIEYGIYLGVAGFILGAFIAVCITHRDTHRRQDSSRYFNRVNPTEPTMQEWSPEAAQRFRERTGP